MREADLGPQARCDHPGPPGGPPRLLEEGLHEKTIHHKGGPWQGGAPRPYEGSIGQGPLAGPGRACWRNEGAERVGPSEGFSVRVRGREGQGPSKKGRGRGEGLSLQGAAAGRG